MEHSSKVVVVIPARYGSTRFPGKALARIRGKPMIQHVYERVRRSPLAGRVVVATDDPRIERSVAGFGGEVMMTSPAHRSGTDRVAEAVEKLGLSDDELVVNVQGDQPLIEPVQVEEVIAPLIEDPECRMATLVFRITDPAEITDPNIVKTVFDRHGNALYFSRSPIPYVRDQGTESPPPYFKHHGIYAYRRGFLATFSRWPSTPLETLEKLEQLRALEHGVSIRVAITAFDSLEIDTPAHIRKAESLL